MSLAILQFLKNIFCMESRAQLILGSPIIYQMDVNMLKFMGKCLTLKYILWSTTGVIWDISRVFLHY